MSEQSSSYDESRLIVNVGLILLSLDSVASRFDDLKIAFVRSALVKQAARRVLERLEQLDAGARPSEAMIRHLYTALEQLGDVEDAARAVAWLRRIVSLRKCEDLSHYWGSVLLLFSPEYAAVLRQLGMRDKSVSLLEELSEKWGDRLNEIEALGESLERSVESEWDRAQHREYQKESDLVSPISFLLSWLRTEAFLKILKEISTHLEPREVQLLEAWGKASASVQTGIPESSLSLEHLNEILASCSDE